LTGENRRTLRKSSPNATLATRNPSRLPWCEPGPLLWKAAEYPFALWNGPSGFKTWADRIGPMNRNKSRGRERNEGRKREANKFGLITETEAGEEREMKEGREKKLKVSAIFGTIMSWSRSQLLVCGGLKSSVDLERTTGGWHSAVGTEGEILCSIASSRLGKPLNAILHSVTRELSPGVNVVGTWIRRL